MTEQTEAVQRIFEHWVKTCRNGSTRAKLGDKRIRVIKKALKLYDEETCIAAINGIVLSPFHQGDNSRGKRYDDITLILRDEEHIEQFADLVDQDTEALQEWLTQ